ncbi:MAG TPA: hypothetical protein VM580_26270 [Labilithrix sp.]|nr:hypothetical protein [Labilithrix sp.]
MPDRPMIPPFPPPDSPIRSELRMVLDARDVDDPTAEDLARVEQRLMAALPPGTLGPTKAATNATVSKGLLGKLSLSATVVGVAAGVWLSRGGSRPEPEIATPVVTQTSSSGATVSAKLSPADLPDAPPEPAPAQESAPLARATANPASVRAEPARSESAILTEAHEAMLRGEPARALALTSDHAGSYPRGALAQERDLIAIESLVALGRRDEARRQGALFRGRYPSSSHIARIDELVGR